MPSINDISIALNSLFLDITDPMTLGLNKNDFFKAFPNTFFRYKPGAEFEFSSNPLFTFESFDERIEFLEKELQLASRFQDFTTKPEMEAMLEENLKTPKVEEFCLEYSVEFNEDKTIIVFDTNSMIFKYEVIG